MRAIDLTQPLHTGMPVYPGDPGVRIERALSMPEDGVEVAHLDLGSHAGTHLDAPSHSIPGGRTVDELPLELLVGAARVLRVRGADAGRIAPGPIRIEDVDLPPALPAIVMIATGWDRHFTPEGFASGAALTHPWVSLELAEALWARGARVLGVDALSPDATVDPETSEAATTLPVHEFWLGGGSTGELGVIVENLAHLGCLPDEVEVSFLPLRLAGVDGSPIRAVAFARD